MKTIENLVTEIQEANHYFSDQVQKQVNVSLTARNWIIGRYIVEYEQAGDDRAAYGDKVLKVLSLHLKMTTKGLSETNLKLFRQFYQIYPHIGQTLSDQFRPLVLPGISQTLSDELTRAQSSDKQQSKTVYSNLVNKLSFSHFIELFKAEIPLKRSFYEIETIKNNWSVRDLQRAMNSMLLSGPD